MRIINSNIEYMKKLYQILEEEVLDLSINSFDLNELDIVRIDKYLEDMVGLLVHIRLDEVCRKLNLCLREKYLLAIFLYSFVSGTKGITKVRKKIISLDVKILSKLFYGSDFVLEKEIRKGNIKLVESEILTFRQSNCTFDEDEIIRELELNNKDIAYYIHEYLDNYKLNSKRNDEGKTIKKLKTSKKSIAVKKKSKSKKSSSDFKSPYEIYSYIRKNGKFVGQDMALKEMSVALFEHVNCFEMDLSPRLLLLGATGSGKTYLIRTVADLFDIPLVIYSATDATANGYIGGSILSPVYSISELQEKYKKNGIIYYDEFDKLAGANTAIRFGGGSNKDVNGSEVQTEMLNLLDGYEIEVCSEGNEFSYTSNKKVVDTKNIMVICGGAFSGIKLLERYDNKKIGFNHRQTGSVDGIQQKVEKNNEKLFKQIIKYGFYPELIYRFHDCLVFQPHNEDTIKEIFNNNFINIQKSISKYNIDLKLSPKVNEVLPKKVLKFESGARGITTLLNSVIFEIKFNEINTDLSKKQILINVDDNSNLNYKIC